MPHNTIYPESLDTVRASDYELSIGENLLKILVSTPKGAILSTTHGIDSSLILSESLAGDSAFLSLVQQGRIRFARWPGGE